MCFLIIILAVLIMIAFYGMSFGFLLFVAIVTGIATILNANGYAKSLRYRPTRKICPACNGTNISFNMVPSIAESSTWNYTRRWSQTNTKISNSKMAICNDCGQSFGYVTESDIIGIQKSSKKALIFSSVVMGLAIVAMIYLASMGS